MRSRSTRNNSAMTKETRASRCCAEFEFSDYTLWQMATIYARMRFWVCNGMLDRLLATLRDLHLNKEISRKSGAAPAKRFRCATVGSSKQSDHKSQPRMCPAAGGVAFGAGAESDRPRRCEPSRNRAPTQCRRSRLKQNSSISTDRALAFFGVIHSTAKFSFRPSRNCSSLNHCRNRINAL